MKIPSRKARMDVENHCLGIASLLFAYTRQGLVGNHVFLMHPCLLPKEAPRGGEEWLVHPHGPRPPPASSGRKEEPQKFSKAKMSHLFGIKPLQTEFPGKRVL